jgi:hypothetical protein
MTSNERLIIAVAIVVVDILVFALPLTAIFAAYILVSRPPWFRNWITRVYEV